MREREDQAVPVDAYRVLRWSLSIIGAIALLAFAAAVVKHSPSLEDAFPGDKILQQQFYLDDENNLPTWFSSVLLLGAAVLAGLLAFVQREDTSLRRRWLGLCFIFVLLSADETSSGHETVSSTLRETFDLGGVLYYAWLIPGMVFVLIVGLLYLGFVWRLPPRVRALVIVAGVTYLSGVVGVELIGGAWADSRGIENLGYGLITTVEELLEMIGATLFIYALLIHLRSFGPFSVTRGGSVRRVD